MKAHFFFKAVTLSLCLGLSIADANAQILNPNVWTNVSPPSTSDLNGVAYGNGLFVAVGGDTAILTSTNGLDWTVASEGITGVTLYSAAFGNGVWVLGGEGAALITTSTDGSHWTNVLSASGMEQVRGLAYGYGLFVAVGSGADPNTSYILTSSNGIDWISRYVPTTNTLFAVTPAVGVDAGPGTNILFVAVGDNGTILTTTNGTDWTPANSGLTTQLRAVAYQNGFIASGIAMDYVWTLVTSPDGVSWTLAPPTYWNIYGLAPSGTKAIVAVGGNPFDGQVNVFIEGLDPPWPGCESSFPQCLNAIASGAGLFVAVGDAGLIVESATPTGGMENDWTKSTSGYWEEAYWSLGQLPAPGQAIVEFGNPGFKALAIGKNTTENFASSLTMNYLDANAPSGSFNLLLLNYAGLDVPLSVTDLFILGPNASLISYYSWLQGGGWYVRGAAAFSEGSIVSFNEIDLESNTAATLSLTNSSLSAGLLSLRVPAAFNQSGGSSQVSNLQMYASTSGYLDGGIFTAGTVDIQSLGGASGLAEFTVADGCMIVTGALRLGLSGQYHQPPNVTGNFTLQAGYLQSGELDFKSGTFTHIGGTNVTATIAMPSAGLGNLDSNYYFLSGGTLISGNVSVGFGDAYTGVGYASFVQSGGVHSNSVLKLNGEIVHQAFRPYGDYLLSAGLLVSDDITDFGAFAQNGGTNLASELNVTDGGGYNLYSGSLVTSNTTVDSCCCVTSYLGHHGGDHIVQNLLLIANSSEYALGGGTLTASNIEVRSGSLLYLGNGVVSNSGTITLDGGELYVSGDLQLGQLAVVGLQAGTCGYGGPPVAYTTLSVGSGTVRFQDSHDVPWVGTLYIPSWSSSGVNATHIFVGTNAQGLTASQLSDMVFVNPVGWSPGNYMAQILSTGEILPSTNLVQALIQFANTTNGMLLWWSGNYQLLTATNLAGPYVPVVPTPSNPFSYPFTDPQRWFRLKSSP